MENGSDYVECMKVNIESLQDLIDTANMIKAANKPYKYVTLDTATKLEELVGPLAVKLYKETAMGKGFQGNTVLTLANGAGYLYLREAFTMILALYRGAAEHIILTGHTKDKTINKQGKELSENSIDLTGKLERIVSASADAIGYVYRVKNQTFINFNGGEDTIVEARPAHLRGKEILIAESDENNIITTYWDKIYK